ncbi:hypothetical protein EVAR_67021_1, partial [Eumeta japonica]
REYDLVARCCQRRTSSLVARRGWPEPAHVQPPGGASPPRGEDVFLLCFTPKMFVFNRYACTDQSAPCADSTDCYRSISPDVAGRGDNGPVEKLRIDIAIRFTERAFRLRGDKSWQECETDVTPMTTRGATGDSGSALKLQHSA